MTHFVFIILFGLTFVFIPSEGKIPILNGGHTRYAEPGENVTIEWSIEQDPTDLVFRAWRFGTKNVLLASISGDGKVNPERSNLQFEVKKPATLILKNVNDSYNGTYTFEITRKSTSVQKSTVTFSVAVQPTVTINCSSPTIVNESDTVRCQCKGEGGNPPANVTWYKDEKPIGVAGDEEKILTLNNVNETNNGTTYKCVAQSYTLQANKSINIIVHVKPNVTINCSSNITVNESDSVRCLCEGKGGYPPANVAWYKNGEMIGDAGYEEKMLTFNNIDETKIGIYECVAQSSNLRAKESIRIIVHFKPTVTNLTFSPKVVGIGENVTIECKASGYPAPSYTITLNDKRVLSNQMTYELTNLNSSHVGSNITCTATNILGSDSRSERLPLAEKTASNESTDGTKWYIIVVALVSGFIPIGIIFSYIFVCLRRRLRNRKPQSSSEPETIQNVNSIYQDLDLSKMNSEDNYQSLRVDSGRNENQNDSAYAELNDVRDVENNYQSLT